jgi:SAM-dependent methyltransferase
LTAPPHPAGGRTLPPPGSCTLCRAPGAGPLLTAHGRLFLGCPECGLLFVDPAHRLAPALERARYETHENDPADPRYRAFLDRMARPLAERLEPGARGLDFGSGPGPTLSVMMEERGFPCRIFDPFFAPDDETLQGEARYDWITCIETAEHLHDPGAEFARLHRLLRPGGWLGVMTEPVPGGEADPPPRDWYYLRDPTHVVFFRERTLVWLARHHGWTVERVERRVTLFRKPEDP